MDKKYINKFHNFKFETNAEKDLEENSPKLHESLSNEMVGDPSSNELLLKYQYAAQEQNNEYKK